MARRSKAVKRGIPWIFTIMVLTFTFSGCISYETVEYRYGLSDQVENAKYVNGEVVQTSVGENTAVELQLRNRDTLFGDIVEAVVYIENFGDTSFDFLPSNVMLVTVSIEEPNKSITANPNSASQLSFPIGFFHRVETARGVGPDLYSLYVANATRNRSGTAIGGVGTYLSGGTIGEAIIAQNQANAAAAARRSQFEGTFNTTRQELLGRYTIAPGSAISGGVGFARTLDVWATSKIENEADLSSFSEGSGDHPIHQLQIYPWAGNRQILDPGSAGYTSALDFYTSALYDLDSLNFDYIRTWDVRLNDVVILMAPTIENRMDWVSEEYKQYSLRSYILVKADADVHIFPIMTWDSK